MVMHFIHAGLLAAICQSPDRDDLRLMMADWLEEEAGKELPRSEFIRVQCEADALESGPGKHADHPQAEKNCVLCARLSALRRRERDLLIAHPANPAWLNCDLPSHPHRMPLEGRPGIYAHGLGVKPMEFEFRRGFVQALTCTAADFLAYGPAIVQCQPLESVNLSIG